MKIVITGGSGFLGSKLSEYFLEKGYEVVSLDIVPPRNTKVFFVKASISEEIPKNEKLCNPDAVINLAGVNVGRKWNSEYKKSIYDSRVLGTKNLIELFRDEKYRPKTLISASAVGIYGERGEKILDEDSEILENQGFLAKVAKDWENEAKKAENYGIRTVLLRQGHILGAGGLVETLLPYYKMGIGGPISSGEHYFPWIHITDLVKLYHFLIENYEISGPVNAVSGNPIKNKEFSQAFAGVLKRPHIFKIPLFVLKIKYGEFASEIVKSQKVVSKFSNKYEKFFEFTEIKNSLKNIFKK